MTGDGGPVLALDVGERRIGVAIGEGTFAFPLLTHTRTNVRDDVAAIVALARERAARRSMPSWRISSARSTAASNASTSG